MTAENAWRIAMEEATAEIERAMDKWGNLDDSGVIINLPMPPAFRAEVEAEELRGMLAEASAFLLLAQWPSAHEGARAHDLVSRIDALSRLEAKGESHDAG